MADGREEEREEIRNTRNTREREISKTIGGSTLYSVLNYCRIHGNDGLAERLLYIIHRILNNDFRGNRYTEMGKICEEVILDKMTTNHAGFVMDDNKNIQIRTMNYGAEELKFAITPDLFIGDKENTIIEIKCTINPDNYCRLPSMSHAMQLISYVNCHPTAKRGIILYFGVWRSPKTPDNPDNYYKTTLIHAYEYEKNTAWIPILYSFLDTFQNPILLQREISKIKRFIVNDLVSIFVPIPLAKLQESA